MGEDTDSQLEFAAAGGGERGEIRSEHHLPVPIGVMQIFFIFLYFFLPRVNGGFDKKELVQNNGCALGGGGGRPEGLQNARATAKTAAIFHQAFSVTPSLPPNSRFPPPTPTQTHSPYFYPDFS